MNVEIVCYIGSEISVASKRIPLFLTKELEAVIETLKDYRVNSYEVLEERLKANGICVFGHGDVIEELIYELTAENTRIFNNYVILGRLGCHLGLAKRRLPLYGEEVYNAVKDSLKSFQCTSYHGINETLEIDNTAIYGEVEVVNKLVFDLIETKHVSKS